MKTLIIAALALTAGELEHLDNLAENPSFEEDRDRDTYPDGWRPYACQSPAELDWDSSGRSSGRRARGHAYRVPLAA